VKNPKIVNEVADTGVADVNIVDARVVYIGIASPEVAKCLGRIIQISRMRRSHYAKVEPCITKLNRDYRVMKMHGRRGELHVKP